MGLFNGKEKETKEEKQARKEQELLKKYGLENLSNQEDIDSVRKIASEMVGSGLSEFGLLLGGGNEKEYLRLQLECQKSIMEQNWIIIRQLDRISKKLGS